jgi:CyaY protein
MNESEFNDLVDETLDAIEEAVDQTLETADVDIDCDNSGSVLTLSCEDGSAIIFSRQSASRELWLAARSGGFHFSYDETEGMWRNTKTQQRLNDMLATISEQQAGAAIKL